jgi:hypothetical protein
MKLAHLTKEQKRMRTNEMAWRRDALESLDRNQHYLYSAAIEHIKDPSKTERLLCLADCMYGAANKLTYINLRLEKYEPHN